MTLGKTNFVRTGELELRHHSGSWSMEFESEDELLAFLAGEGVDVWEVVSRNV